MLGIGYLKSSYPTNYALPQQAHEVQLYCAANDISLMVHFVEDRLERGDSQPSLSKAAVYARKLQLIAKVPVCLVVADLFTFSSDPFRSEAIRRALEHHGIPLLSVAESYLNPPLAKTEAPTVKRRRELDIMRRMVDSEYTRVIIDGHTSAGRAKKRDMSHWIGHRPLFETDVSEGELVLNEERARIVRLINRLYKLRKPDGERMFSYRDIADYLNGSNQLLNADGTRGRKFISPTEVPTKKRRTTAYKKSRGLWHFTTVGRIIKETESGYRQGVVKSSRVGITQPPL